MTRASLQFRCLIKAHTHLDSLISNYGWTHSEVFLKRWIRRFLNLLILVKPRGTSLPLCQIWLKSASKLQTSQRQNSVVQYTQTDHTNVGFLRQKNWEQYIKFYLHTTSNFPSSIILQRKHLHLWKKREREQTTEVAKPLNVSNNFARLKRETSYMLVVFNK